MSISKQNWEDYIKSKLEFYLRHLPVSRKENDYFLEIMSTPGTMIREYLKSLPFLYKTYKFLKQSEQAELTPSEVDALYEVRCLLNDELSQLLFDETIILRRVSQHRFFFPRTFFDTFVNVVESAPFLAPEFPHEYLQWPLYSYKIRVCADDTERELNVVAAKGFDGCVNQWRQYFISREMFAIRPRPAEVVFDCGACIGDIAVIFAGLVGPSGQVHVFDPIPLHNRFCALQAQLNPALSGIFNIHQTAVGSGVKKVSSGHKLDSGKIAPGGLQVDTFDITDLDSFTADKRLERVDFIKMDIEGAERDALSGAEGIIREFGPTLAISTYHRPEDFWSLPLLIKKIKPDYKLAFGHHSPMRWESVIYAYKN
jgi:FkbM family methyltransferase